MSSISDIKLIRTDFLYFENLLQNKLCTIFTIFTGNQHTNRQLQTKERTKETTKIILQN